MCMMEKVVKMNKTKSIIAALLVAFGVGTYVGYAKHDDIKKSRTTHTRWLNTLRSKLATG